MTKHVFIIDDDNLFRLMTVKMIEKSNEVGLQLYECKDGEEGLLKLQKLENSKDKIIIFLDINMPVLDGWGFLDQFIQEKQYGIHNIAIYMVSSSTNESDILKAKEYAVVKNYIFKPLNFNTLKESLKA